MKKLLTALVGVTLIAGIALANRYEQLSVGELTVETSIVNSGTDTVTGAQTATGRITANGGVTVSDPLILTSSSANVTNGQEITLSEPVHILSGTGMATGDTCTNTIANTTAALVGQFVTIIGAGATNSIALNDSGNLRLSGAWAAATNQYDSITLYVVATNIIVEVGASDN